MNASYQQLANPPNLIGLMVQAQQRQEAMAGINAGFAQIAANHSPPSMRNAIMQNANAGAGDAGSMFGNIMSLYQGQQQMAAQQALLAQSPDIAAKTGLPEATVRAQILAGRGDELVRNMEATPEVRKIQWEHDQFIKGGGDEATWQRDYLPQIITQGMPGASDPMWQVYRTERQHALETDPNNPFPNYADWTAQRQASANADMQKKQAQTQAIKDRPAYDASLLDLRTRASAVLDDANQKDLDAISKLPSDVINAVLEPGRASDLAQFLASKNLPGLTGTQIDLIRSLHELSTSNMHDLAASNPNRAQDLVSVGQNLAGLGRFDVGVGGLKKNAQTFIDNVDRARGNAWGATGDLANMPDELRLKMDPSYGYGGSNFSGTAQAMTSTEIAEAQKDIKDDPKDKPNVLRWWRSKGKNTKPIE